MYVLAYTDSISEHGTEYAAIDTYTSNLYRVEELTEAKFFGAIHDAQRYIQLALNIGIGLTLFEVFYTAYPVEPQ